MKPKYFSKPKYYNTNWNSYFAVAGMKNCVNHALGRIGEITGKKESWLGNPYKDSYNSDGTLKNKSIWNSTASSKKSKTPKLGSAGIFEAGSTGHIAIVEEIFSNGDILVSEGAYIWSDSQRKNVGYEYKEVKLTKSSGYKHPFGKSVGFVETYATKENETDGGLLKGWTRKDFVDTKKNRITRKFNGKTYDRSVQTRVKLNYYPKLADVGTGKRSDGKAVRTFPADQLLDHARIVKDVNGYKAMAILNDVGSGEVFIAYHKK